MFSRRLTSICATALALSAAVSCSRSGPSPLIGRWVDIGAPVSLEAGAPLSQVGCAKVSNVHFLPDGSFLASSWRGFYKVLDTSQVRLDYSTQPTFDAEWEYRISGDTLILKERGLTGAVCHFTRAK